MGCCLYVCHKVRLGHKRPQHGALHSQSMFLDKDMLHYLGKTAQRPAALEARSTVNHLLLILTPSKVIISEVDPEHEHRSWLNKTHDL